MADKTRVGLELPHYIFVVERVKIREFVEAIGDDNPIFLDREAAISAGYQDTPCPPTFITSAFQEFTGAYFKVFEELVYNSAACSTERKNMNTLERFILAIL